MNQTAWEEVGMTTSKPRAAVAGSAGGRRACFRRWVDGEWTVASFRRNARRNTSVGQARKRAGRIPAAPIMGPGLQKGGFAPDRLRSREKVDELRRARPSRPEGRIRTSGFRLRKQGLQTGQSTELRRICPSTVGSPLDYNVMVSTGPLVTVVETPEFLTRVGKLMTEGEREALIAYLAANPTAGDLIQGTGGVRKLRWGLEGRGRRGGARVIFLFQKADLPLFALTIFAKNERVDLSQRDRNDLGRLTKVLIDTYRRTRP